MRVVAGIDGSTKKTGIAIMRDDELTFYTLIDLSRDTNEPLKRIQKMLFKIGEVLDKHDIDEVCMEKAFNKSNTQTTMMLANIAGGVMYYCAKNKIKFTHPEPSAWRKKIGFHTGRGVKRDVLKAEAVKAVQNEYGITVGDDVAESVLLARSAFDLPKINMTEDDLWS